MNANAANQELPTEVAETAGAAVDLGPGRVLREARERMNLDVLSAANRLNLHRSVIDALEADDFAALPEAIFVRGYLRNYARLLGLDSEEMIALYESAAGVPALKTTAAQNDRMRGVGDEHSGAGGGIVWLVVVLLVMALAGGGFVWWKQTQRAMGPAAPAADPAAAVAPLSEPVGEGRLETPSPVDEAPMEPVGGESTEGGEAPAEPAVREPVVLAPPSEAPVSEDTPVAEAPPEPAVEAVASPEAEVASSLASDEAAPAEGNRTQLRASFIEDCWSEITDGEGTKLLFRIARAGETVTLEGVPPIKVLFGRANAVTVEVDGLPFDLRPHTQANIARVVLGEIDPEADAAAAAVR